MIYLDQTDIFAAFRLPGTKETCLMIQRNESISLFDADSLNKKGFAVYPFDDKDETAIFINSDELYFNAEFCFHSENHCNSPSELKDDYLENAEIFIEAVKTNFEKLVLSRTKSVNYRGGNLYDLFKILEKKYNDAFVFLINHPLTGTWTGASPEILLTKKDNLAQTIALAGTQLIEKGKSIKWSEKEIKEQKTVMDYIENILKLMNIEFDTIGPFNKIAAKYDNGDLVHIATEYFFRADEKIFDLLKQMHPTPAVCGLPKDRAFDFITKKEKFRRKYYSGFLGPVNHIQQSEFHFYVNLRSMEVFKDKFILYLGGGFNNGSVKEKEWEETENKAKTMEAAIEEYHTKKN